MQISVTGQKPVEFLDAVHKLTAWTNAEKGRSYSIHSHKFTRAPWAYAWNGLSGVAEFRATADTFEDAIIKLAASLPQNEEERNNDDR